jgi:hypothetical protein
MAITAVGSSGRPPTFGTEDSPAAESAPGEEASEGPAEPARLGAAMRLALMVMEQSQASEAKRDQDALAARETMIEAQKREIENLRRAAERKQEAAFAGAVIAGAGGVIRVASDIATANAAGSVSAAQAMKDAATTKAQAAQAAADLGRAERLKAGYETVGAGVASLEGVANKIVENTINDAEEKARIAAKEASQQADRAKADEQRTHDAARDAGRAQSATRDQLRAMLAQEHDAQMRLIPA